MPKHKVHFPRSGQRAENPGKTLRGRPRIETPCWVVFDERKVFGFRIAFGVYLSLSAGKTEFWPRLYCRGEQPMIFLKALVNALAES